VSDAESDAESYTEAPDDFDYTAHLVWTPVMPKRERMSADEVADLLGVKPSTVRGYASRGQMPKPSACPCCGTSSWVRSEVEDWNKRRLHGPRASQ
jgi:predicted DNA-binding transcriptional regulator AlpA